MNKRQIGYYDYTVILTYCGMLFSFAGILLVLEELFLDAVLCLMAAGICDMFDGAVASTKDRNTYEKQFGIQIDSLSDLISFGVFPGIFVYMVCEKNLVVAMISGLYVLCALIRLAYFNVLEEERQKQTTEKRKSYLGIPVTSVAILLPAIYLLFDNVYWKKQNLFPVLLVLLSLGFVAPVEIKKPQIIGKIFLILVGIFEAVAVVLSAFWGAI